MAKIDKNLKILLGVGIVLLAGVAVFAINTQSEIDGLGPAAVVQVRPKPALEQSAVLIIDSGSEKPVMTKLKIEQASTAFDLLKQGAEKLEIALQTKMSDMGVFVEVIGGQENGQDGKYWLYYVNGEMPQVAADKQEIKSGDKVDFRFEKSPW